MSRVLPILSALFGAALIGWSAQRYVAALEQATEAADALTVVADQATQLDRLRASAPVESRRSRPAPGLASRIAQVVAVTGLSQGTLQNVTPEVETGIGTGTGINYRRTAVRLTLDPITLPELGRFLQEWRAAEPAWTVSTIDLTPTSNQAKGGQKPLRAALFIETVFAATTDAKERTNGNP
ncbi:MAG TPA: hypothetical protein VD997_17470 [Phycisphaerales bacterium]|nr:hypothetical protein [Phycisphaerales bacterium]